MSSNIPGYGESEWKVIKSEILAGKFSRALEIADKFESQGDRADAINLLRLLEDAGSEDANQRLLVYFKPQFHGPSSNVDYYLYYLERLANKNNQKAMLDLADIYGLGLRGTEIDRERERYWINTAKELGSIEAMFRAARIDLTKDSDSISRAVKTLNELAAKDHVESMIALLDHYSNGGWIDEKNSDKYFKWARKSATLNDPRGAFHLSAAYSSGIGVPRDPSASLSWIKKAADQKEPRALLNLSEIYRLSPKEAPSENRYFELLQQAAELEDPRAMINLAMHYLSGIHVERDAQKAIQLLESAALKNEPSAMMSLAKYYIYDVNEENRDESKYLYWIKRAAALGHEEAVGAVCAYFYKCALYDPSDCRFRDFTQVKANEGNAHAMYMLGVSFRSGIGVGTINWRLGSKWIERAANKGLLGAISHIAPNKPLFGAMWDIATVYRDGVYANPEMPVEADDESFFYWALEAAKRGHCQAIYHIILAYYEGKGTSRNLDECQHWLERSPEFGDRHAHIITSFLQLEKSKKIADHKLFEEAQPFFDLQNVTSRVKKERVVGDSSSRIAHFTDITALDSILPRGYSREQFRLRLYNANSMEDEEEGQELFRIKNNPTSELLRDFFPPRDVNSPFLVPIGAQEYSVYICSFAGREDSLDLWRQYGRDSTGFCIVLPIEAFDQDDNPGGLDPISRSRLQESGRSQDGIGLTPPELRSRFQQQRLDEHSVRAQLFRISYTNEEIERVLQLLDRPLRDIKGFKERFRQDDQTVAIIDELVRSSLCDLLYLFKNSKFSSENEMRILCAFDSGSDFVQSDERATPSRLYVKTRPLVFSKERSELIIGSRVANPRNLYLDLDARLARKGLRETTAISSSKI